MIAGVPSNRVLEAIDWASALPVMDVETGMITHHETTPTNGSGMNAFTELLDGTESAAQADKGHNSRKNRETLERISEADGIMRRAAEKNVEGAYANR